MYVYVHVYTSILAYANTHPRLYTQICLVDFNQATQLVEGVKTNRIVGIIDHHALQSKTVTIVCYVCSERVKLCRIEVGVRVYQCICVGCR